METAPLLKADGLSGDYRLLAEFNGVVLAGHERDSIYGIMVPRNQTSGLKKIVNMVR